jgi:hypothetical protein
METSYGLAKRAKSEAEASLESANQGSEILTAMKKWASPVTNVAEAYSKASKEALEKSTAALQRKHLEEAKKLSDVLVTSDHDQSYALAAKNVYILSKEGEAASGIDLLALGQKGEFNGQIDVRATGQVALTCGGAASLGLRRSTETQANIVMLNNLEGSIHLQQGSELSSPQMHLQSKGDNQSIAINAGQSETSCKPVSMRMVSNNTPTLSLSAGEDAANAASLTLQGAEGSPSFKLAVGSGNTAGSLEIGAAGITMKWGQLSFTMSNAGIKLATPSANLELTSTDLNMTYVNSSQQGSGSKKESITMLTLDVSGTSKCNYGIQTVN